ncbi:MAG: hypothetical protein JXN65_09800 [Clostridia bacterium]|nr:hypothetical protein [Clostridia bacterium]
MKKFATRLYSPAAAILLLLVSLFSTAVSYEMDPYSYMDEDEQEFMQDNYGNIEADMYQVLVDTEEVKITSLGFGSDTYGFGLKLEIENKTDEEFTVQVREFSINGYGITTYFSPDVQPGNVITDLLEFDTEEMTMVSIEEIVDIQFKLHVFTWDDFNDVFNSDLIHINTGSSYVQEYIEFEGKELYNAYGIKIVLLDLDYSNPADPKIYLYIENDNDKAMSIHMWDFAINGQTTECYFSADIPAGMRSVSCLNKYDNLLRTSGEDEINALTFEFMAISSDFSFNLDIDPITVTIE